MRISSELVYALVICLLASTLALAISLLAGTFVILFTSIFIFCLLLLFILTVRKYPKLLTYCIAYGVPLLILLYVLIFNFLPAEPLYELDVGKENDTDTRLPLYLVEDSSVGPRQMIDGTYFRTISDVTSVIFNPKERITGKTITITAQGDGVSILLPETEINPKDYEWNFIWDFTLGYLPYGVSLDEGAQSPTPFLTSAGVNFNGSTRLIMANTEDLFEDGPFTLYVEWTPKSDDTSFQQIIGHYNWELVQDVDQVRFQIGRMNDQDGQIYSVAVPVSDDFFGKKHSVLATYNPDQGYMYLAVDGALGEKRSIGNNVIWKDYNKRIPLSFGNSEHGSATPYIGVLHRAYLLYGSEKSLFTNATFVAQKESIQFFVDGEGAWESVRITLE